MTYRPLPEQRLLWPTGSASLAVVIRPVAATVQGLDRYLERVSGPTGLDRNTLKQALVGEGIRLLTVGNDKARLSQLRDTVRALGVPAALVRTVDLRELPAPRVIERVEFLNSPDRLILTEAHTGERISLAQGGAWLATIGSLEAGRYGEGGNLIQTMYGTTDPVARSQAHRGLIAAHSPALALLTAENEGPLLVLGNRFALEEAGRASVLAYAIRFGRLVELLETKLGTAVEDDFGRRRLAFGPLAGEPADQSETLALFELYSRLLWLALGDGLDAPLPAEAAGAVRLIERPEPQRPSQAAGATNSDRGTEESALRDRTWVHELLMLTRWIGPSWLVFPLAALSFYLLLEGVLLENPSLFWGGAAALGALLCSHAFSAAWLRRLILDLPTSRIRSLALGPVELKGKTAARERLIAPVSGAPCVYYCLSYYRNSAPSGRDDNWRLVRRIDSGDTPFYLAGDGGRVLIDPGNCRFPSLERTENLGTMLEMLSGVGNDGRRKVVEEALHEGRDLYVFGFARPNPSPDGGDPADGVLVGAPPIGGPLLLSETPEETLVGSLRFRALSFGSVGTGLMLYSAFRIMHSV